MTALALPPILPFLESSVNFQLQPLLGQPPPSPFFLPLQSVLALLFFTLGILVPRTPSRIIQWTARLLSAAILILFPWIIRARQIGRVPSWCVLLGPLWMLSGLGVEANKGKATASFLIWRLVHLISGIADTLRGILIGVGLSSLQQVRIWGILGLLASSPKSDRVVNALLLFSLLLPSPALPSHVISRVETKHGFLSTSVLVQREVAVLRLDTTILGARYTESGDSAFGSFYFPSFARFAIPRNEGRKALILGLGIGVDAAELVRAGWEVDAVEMVKEIPDMARESFGLPRVVNVTIGDAWNVVSSAVAAREKYELVIVDIFAGVPATRHDLPLDRLEALKALLSPNGIVVINIVARPRAAPAIVAVLQTRFPHVRIFTESIYREDDENSNQGPPKGFEEQATNLVCFLSSQPLTFNMPSLEKIDFRVNPVRSEMMDLFTKMELDPKLIKEPVDWDGKEAAIVVAQHAEAMDRMFDWQFWAGF